METDIIDKLFLELSHITKAKTKNEAMMLDCIHKCKEFIKSIDNDEPISLEDINDILQQIETTLEKVT